MKRTRLERKTELKRRTRIKPVSAKRRAENKVRRANGIKTYGENPRCWWPDCTTPAEHLHELKNPLARRLDHRHGQLCADVRLPQRPDRQRVRPRVRPGPAEALVGRGDGSMIRPVTLSDEARVVASAALLTGHGFALIPITRCETCQQDMPAIHEHLEGGPK